MQILRFVRIFLREWPNYSNFEVSNGYWTAMQYNFFFPLTEI